MHAPMASLYFSLFLAHFSTLAAQTTHKNMTLGSSLTAHNDDDSFWVSESGHFAFGFRQSEPQQGDYLLAIWFNKIVEKTVVWSANRNKLAPGGSKLLLTPTGQLLLNDPRGNQIWTTNLPSTNPSVSHAAILDNGNFILATTESMVVWQSFDFPTDTILPSQIVKQGQILVAPYSEANYSTGRYQLSMQKDGHLMLNPREFPSDSITKAYWATSTAGSGFQLVFNLSGSIYLVDKNETIIYHLTSNNPSTEGFYHRAILEYDGVFRHFVYPKLGSGSNPSWSKAWTQVSVSIPPNICTAFDSGTGSGPCGFNSYCTLGADQRPTCTCAPGYVWFDQDDDIKSCKPNFVPQTCYDVESSRVETDSFDFFPLENANWPAADYGHFNSVTEDRCRNECLSDCFCVAVTFSNGDCWKKKFPLSFGRMDTSVRGKALIKIRRDNSTLEPDNHASKGLNLRAFSYEELDKATAGFSEQLGSGASSTVYRGTLDSVDNNLVAVKKLDNMVREGGDQEFKAEVSAIARTNHKNLVRLLGFCNEEEHRMLVYEFMQNGSLADFLFAPSKPTWYQRIQVVLGTARGLCYLHEECSTQIIHCDIKPQNILLDGSFAARTADFGLAKLLKKDQTRTMTAIRGTKGYVAPEWFRSLPVTVKVDVYSFGIVLLELICCRKSFEAEAEHEDEMILSDWAYDCMKARKMEMLVRNDEEANNDMKRVEKYVKIGIWCIQEEPSLRPSMKKVIQMLEGAVEVSTPPDPSSFISTI